MPEPMVDVFERLSVGLVKSVLKRLMSGRDRDEEEGSWKETLGFDFRSRSLFIADASRSLPSLCLSSELEFLVREGRIRL
jgi:hypothetical protein